MANRNLARPFCYQKMLTILTGKVYLNSSAAVVSVAGIGFSAAKSGTGLYTITLEDQFNDVQAADVSLLEPTLTALKIAPKTNYTSITTGKSGTIQFQIVNTSAVATDVAQASEIHFRLHLKNTSVAL